MYDPTARKRNRAELAIVIIGAVYRCPNITKQNNEQIHNAINEVSKGDCIIMGDFNHGILNGIH